MTRPIYYPCGPSEERSNDAVPKKDIGGGRLLQMIGEGEDLNGVHWNIPDGATVDPHQHESEQLGYVIRGSLEMTVGEEKFLIREGDSYVIPSHLTHAFRAVGDVEAVDIFSPRRDLSGVLGTR